MDWIKSKALFEILIAIDDKFLAMEEYIERLEKENKKLIKEQFEILDRSIKDSEKMVGTVFSALLDENSIINKGIKADAKEKLDKIKE
jgi:hypothetical protein